MVESGTTPTSDRNPRLIDELNELHARYADAINRAIADDNQGDIEELAAAYDRDAVQLIAEREGKTHLLPLVRPAGTDTPLRRMVRRLTASRAA